MRTDLYIERGDLTVFPETKPDYGIDEAGQITLGDLHGSALKLIYILIRWNILSKISEADYKVLADIYVKPIESLKKDDLHRFDSIIMGAELKPIGMLRLIGDILADGGSNDYFTLLVLKKLNQAKIPLRILLSNHDMEFIIAYERGGAFVSDHLQGDQSISMKNLETLRKKNWVTVESVAALVREHYLPFIVPLDASFDEGRTKLTLYSHAPIGLLTLQRLTAWLGVPYAEGTEGLAKTIASINEVFVRDYVRTRKINSLFDLSGGASVPEGMANPIVFLTWNRRSAELRRPDTYAFVHGHHQGAPSGGNVINLDAANELGAKTYERSVYTDGPYPVLYCPEQLPLGSKAALIRTPAANHLFEKAEKEFREALTLLPNQHLLKKPAELVLAAIVEVAPTVYYRQFLKLSELLELLIVLIEKPARYNYLQVAYADLIRDTGLSPQHLSGFSAFSIAMGTASLAAGLLGISHIVVSEHLSIWLMSISGGVLGSRALAVLPLALVTLFFLSAFSSRDQGVKSANFAKAISEFWKVAQSMPPELVSKEEETVRPLQKAMDYY